MQLSRIPLPMLLLWTIAGPGAAQVGSPGRSIATHPSVTSWSAHDAGSPPGEAAVGVADLPRSRLERSVPLAGLFGLGGAALGYLAGLLALGCTTDDRDCDLGPEDAEYGTGVLGLALGSAAGAHWGGLRSESRGHLGLTLLSAGLAGALPVLFEWDNADAPRQSLIAAPVAAALVDHLVRRPRRRAR